MNSIQNPTSTDLAEKTKRVNAIVTQIEECISKFEIIKNHNRYEFRGYIPNTNTQIDQKTKIALIAMMHDEQLKRIKDHPHMSLYVIFGTFICLYDGRMISWKKLNLEKTYQTKYIDINMDDKNLDLKMETMSIIYIDANPIIHKVSTKSPISGLKEEFRKYINTTIIDILLKGEWLKRKVVTSVDNIVSKS
jgi:frataxin-like iron-binding protein CyaY